MTNAANNQNIAYEIINWFHSSWTRGKMLDACERAGDLYEVIDEWAAEQACYFFNAPSDYQNAREDLVGFVAEQLNMEL